MKLPATLLSTSLRYAFVRLRICDCLVRCHHLIGRHEFSFRAALVAAIDELAVDGFRETEH